MIRLFGNNRRKRIISFFLLITFVSEIITPTATLALTGGPSQPEVQAFTPINTSEMVDLTSGDFKYNIPLMDVGGYPLNIAYNSGIGMDQEASWVGLGWNLNVGAINRNMRGLPDDFNGEQIEKEFNMKDNNTFGVNVGVGVEIFGWKKTATSSSHGSLKLNVGLGLTYNNYTGIGMEQSASLGISAGNSGKGSMNAGLGMSASNSGGLTISPSLSFSYKTDEKQKGDETTAGSAGIGLGMSMNSRSGLKDLSVNASYNRTTEKTTKLYVPTFDGGSFSGFTEVSKSSSQSGGMSSAGVINFGASTFIPQVHNDMVNNSVALSFKLGTTIFGLDGDITLSGYFSNQSLMSKSSSLPAYGYMFSQNGQNADNVLMDFNREKDQSFSRFTKNLPITNQTYDVFSVSGQGIGGSFRPFRSDIGYMFDNAATTTSDSYSGGAEFAAAETAHLGVNISVVDVHTTTGKWTNDNDAIPHLKSLQTAPYKGYEPYYFREVGEKSTDEVQSTLYSNLGGDIAKRIEITGLINHKANGVLETGTGSATTALTVNCLPKRQKRNQVMSTLNFDEAKLYGLDKTIYNQTNSAGMNINSAAKSDHIAEITALRLDGSRYIYGLPAYNTDQEEVTFNASDKTTSSNSPVQNGFYDVNTGYVSYNTGDRSTSNSKGIDNYYNKVKMPAYAHSYLLTAVISPDYVDITGNGPTDDDFGNYTKFEYTKVPSYKWRMPYDNLKANFNEAGKSIENDDQGNFVYGEKELWFTTKIETKNYIAIFDLQDRNDGRSVAGIDGSAPNSGGTATKYINAISLYSKPEYTASPSTAVPIKVVHFTYDYSLCKGIPNNSVAGQGKLTLKEVYFTYGKSSKAAFSKYKFTYDQKLAGNPTSSSNFNYHPKAYDRWGNYMPLNNGAPGTTQYSYTSPLNNSEFPYTDQFSKDNADYRASAWNLTCIELPSGGNIKINYEADDYAFVQNRPAMQMMKVVGMTKDLGSYSSPGLAPNIGNLYSGSDDNLYLHFELTENLAGTLSASDEIRQKYLKDINSDGKYLYFRFLVNLTNTNSVPLQNTGDHFEYVSGYAELDGSLPPCGLSGGPAGPNGFPIAYVKLKSVVIDDKTTLIPGQTNPIAKAALNFGKSHYNNIVWDASFSPPADVITAVEQLASAATGGFAKQMLQAIAGPNKSLEIKNYGQQFVYGKSWVRLYNPSGHKFGGGSRVKELTIKDNWQSQTTDGTYAGQDDSEYGQQFTYETEFNGETISSGVASYEPMLGNDENPFRQPVFMGPNKWSLLVPDERFFMEEPFGETFFPSASIAYSKIKVQNKIPSAAVVKTHGTGYVVHEYYTAKDYPTLTSHTSIDPKQWKPPLGGLLKIMARDYVSASQGYVIKLNDMHGKEKGQFVYSEGNTSPISQVQYFYKTKGPNGYTDYGLKDIHSDASCVPNELDNTCFVIDRAGAISSTTIGTDFDAVADFRENETTTIMGGAQINLSMFLVGIFPGIVPTIWPDFSYEKTRFRSAVMTKVVSDYGILDKTTATDLGSIVTTSNLAFDAQTGDVLVTKTKNDYEDEIYSLKYPAFWGYDLMGPAYKNIGLSDNTTFTGGVASITSADSYYNVGDELALGGGTVGWVCNVTSSQISVIDKLGMPFSSSGSIHIKVLRSGRRNLLTGQMTSLTSLVNPIDFNEDGTPDATLGLHASTTTNDYKVINTSAAEYSDGWQTFKGYNISTKEGCNCTYTPIGYGFISLISGLTAAGALLNFDTLYYYPTNSYHYGYTPVLHNMDGGYPGYNDTWSPESVVHNVALIQFLYQTHYCELQLELPAGIDWTDVHLTGGITSNQIVKNPDNCTATKIQFCSNNLLADGTLAPICFTLSPGPATGKCHDWFDCSVSAASNIKCGVDVGDLVNPFVYGIKGNWRPKTNWSFLEARAQTTPSGGNNLDVRRDGPFASYSPYYTYSSSTGKWSPTPTSWTFTSEITKHTPDGVEVENRDALNRYSAAQYGYRESLPVAVASNAQHQEIGFDGFEDYDFFNYTCDNFSRNPHFGFYQYKTNLDNTVSHTGRYSMKLNPNSNLIVSGKLTSVNCTTPVSPFCSYYLSCSDFIYPFSPITYNGAKKYILSYWVKEIQSGNASTSALDYVNSSVGLAINGTGAVTPGLLKKSELIDGWQRYEQDFTISAGATGGLKIGLRNTDVTGSFTSYFDDIRVHPFNSNMKSYVYDPVTLKYVAELDANNFATFYEYDEEGSLVRIKKETEKGIMTIQETKNHTKR